MGIVEEKLLLDRHEIESEIGKFEILTQDTFETRLIPSKVLITTDDCYFVAYIEGSTGRLALDDVTWVVDGAINHKQKEKKKRENEFRRDLKKYREARKSIDD
jgi:hypothetical protein